MTLVVSDGIQRRGESFRWHHGPLLPDGRGGPFPPAAPAIGVLPRSGIGSIDVEQELVDKPVAMGFEEEEARDSIERTRIGGPMPLLSEFPLTRTVGSASASGDEGIYSAIFPSTKGGTTPEPG